MATTVSGGFQVFLSELTPTKGESEAAKSHRASIKACLEKEFGMTSFFRIGSFGSGTSIRDYSDVDYFAVIPRKNLKKNSGYTLGLVRDVLKARFPKTDVSVRTPAVVVPFGTDASETTEVVPADYMEKSSDGNNVYEIPDRDDTWMRSSPSAHRAYVDGVDSQLSRKVKPLVRFVKAWKYYRNVPILSFYLELRVAKYSSGESTIIYPIDVKRVFKTLWDCQLASMQDPMRISGYVSACPSDSKKKDALSKLKTALARADKAVTAKNDEKIDDAFYWWDLVFDGHFPPYG